METPKKNIGSSIGIYRENVIAIESEAIYPKGGNVYYVTMQITFHIPEFSRKDKERNTKKDDSYLPSCNVFGGIWRSLVAFDVVSVAPRIGGCVTVAYESRARWRSPRQHNHIDVLVLSSRSADDVTRERRREGLG